MRLRSILDAVLNELGGDFGGADRAEHLASFAGLDGEDELDGGELGGGRVGGLEVAGFTDFAGLLEGLDVLRVGAVDGERDALREQDSCGRSPRGRGPVRLRRLGRRRA
jgi:hypothetical protein